MRKDTLQVGDIFNKIYVGDNQLYGKCNGKTTNILESIKGDEIRFRQFYCSSGRILDPQIKGGQITWSMDYMINKGEYEIIKINHVEQEGFIHAKVLDLMECYQSGLIEQETIKKIFRSQESNFIRTSPLTYHTWENENDETESRCSFSYSIEPFTHPDFPYLQKISFIYNNREELYDDVDKVFGIKSYRM